MSDAPPEVALESITFHYIKAMQFRVIHVDGAIGSLTPRGFIHAAMYSERAAIPQMMVHPIEGGQLGPPTEVVSRPGMVREVEVSLMFDLDAAVSFRDWLSTRIDELKTTRSAADMRSAKAEEETE
ncbi:MAG TPA: hypothetical protein VND87_07040 [Stellaceae bacterium]|nr:hypothetical protein [Stellaceae bacterium]